MSTFTSFMHQTRWLYKFLPRNVYSNVPAMYSLVARRIHMGEHFQRGTLKDIQLQAPVPLAGRKYLASSGAQGFPKYLSGPRDNFPLMVKVKNGKDATMKHWAQRSREIIDQAYQQYDNDGTAVAILFRGFPNANASDFAEWASNLGFKPFPYVGGKSNRKEIAFNVADGAADDDVVSIELHNEMAYSIKYPKIFTISCFQKSSWGGETAICDNRELYRKLDRRFVQKCEDKEIRYWHCVPDKNSDGYFYMSWQQKFLTDDRSKVNTYLKENNYGYVWENDDLRFWHNLSPYTKHTRSGERLWFNQITGNHCSYFVNTPQYERVKLPNTAYPSHATYGDGEEIEEYYLDHHRSCNWESAVAFQWQNGDILFLDQQIVQHSRLGFGGDRKVGVSLLDY